MADPNRRIWPPDADRTVTVRITDKQFIRWMHDASRYTSKPHLGRWIAQAADVYSELQRGTLLLIRRPEEEE